MESEGRLSGLLSRRAFLDRAIVGVLTPALVGCGGTAAGAERSGRLAARPRTPTLETPRGLHPLGLASGRDGILYVPETLATAQPAPLLVALHGATGAGRSWEGYLARADERGFVLLAPDSRARTWDLLTGGYGPDVHFLDRALDHLFARVPIDAGRVALAGFSDGASYALSLGARNGDLFTHLIAYSPGFADLSEAVGRPPAFVSHGRGDRVLSFARTEARVVPALRGDGREVTWRPFEGGHEVPAEITEAALGWFLGDAGTRAVARPQEAWDELVRAENAFATRAGEIGISAAFLEVLAPDGIVFAPGPVPGRAEHAERPAPREAYLRWHPRLAGVSRDGDLGYTTGPWVAGRGDEPPGAAGHYLSVWGRAPDGGWALLADIGVSHPPLDDQQVRREAVAFPADEAPGSAPAGSREEATRSLSQRQRLFHMVLSLDAALPLPSLMRRDARVYVEGAPPDDGPGALAGKAASGRAWEVLGTDVAGSLDLAYAWGTTTRPGVERVGNFLEIWTRGDGDWALALVLLQEA